jgi:preprotein translocase subunit YajC
MTDLFLLLAQPTTSRPAGGPMPDLFSSPLLLLVLMGLVMYFVLMRPQSQEKKRREQMLKAIKKNDRVVTVGGILGVVQSVKDDEVTLKVDESSNTKITFTRSSISRVVSAGPAESGTASGAPPKN